MVIKIFHYRTITVGARPLLKGWGASGHWGAALIKKAAYSYLHISSKGLHLLHLLLQL